MTPPKVLGTPKPASSVMISNTFGAPFGGTMRGAHQGVDCSASSLMTPPNAGSGAGMRELGVDLQPIVAAQGLSWRVFEDPDESIAYRTLCALLAACVRASGCPHLGLLVGRGGGVSTLGALGYLIQNTPDVRTALDTLISHMDVHDRGAAPTLELRAHVAMLRYDIFHADAEGSIPVSDAAMAISRNIMLSLCGPAWKPMEVHFRHAPPEDVTPYRQLFQAPVVFNAERTALVFRTQWLSTAVPGADGQLRRHFQGYVDAMANRLERGFEGKVYATVQRLLVKDRCTLDALALQLGLQPRTLNRRLQDAGTSFRALQNQARTTWRGKCCATPPATSPLSPACWATPVPAPSCARSPGGRASRPPRGARRPVRPLQ
jgi:hypothetical protein